MPASMMPAKPDPLLRYRRKRDFSVTGEPSGHRETSGAALRFVVQEHAARRLHYDFRLELDGTLKSWAVPKGPSLDPRDKRLAVEVEDHPLSYADFEGTIPPKQYGAGTVIVWDTGAWRPIGDARAGYAAGRLKFELDGHKLSGRWSLVRLRADASARQPPWLLIKEQDAAARASADFDVLVERPGSALSAPSDAKAHSSGKPTAASVPKERASRRAGATRNAAGVRPPVDDPANGPPDGAVRAALPDRLAPQLATLVDQVPASGDWRYEVKFDGYRLLARLEGGRARLLTRNGHDWTARLKGVVQAVERLGLGEGWLDGEIVVAGEDGMPDFQRLQNAFDREDMTGVEYFVFDLPYAAGYDLRAVPLQGRRALLRSLVGAGPADGAVRFSEDFPVSASDLLHAACALRIEGLIGKRADARYVSARSSSWIKLKCTQRQEFVVAGFTEPTGQRTGLGALVLGVHDAGGALRHVGSVGTGFSEATLGSLRQRLERLRQKGCPFEAVPAGVRAHWVKPSLVAEVSFAQWTRDGRIRHAVFHGLRGDKPGREIVRERAGRPAPAPPAREPVLPAAADAPPSVDGTPARMRWPDGVRLTHPDRVVDAASGITKRELAAYALSAASHWLPHLARRPVALLRAPDGVGGETFFQKHAGPRGIPQIRTLDPALDPGHEPLLEIAARDALLGAVQMNAIELHTWNATTRSIEKPDRVIFDIDPGEKVAWSQVREAAQLLHALLGELSLESFLKTSGGKGLHVVVPCRSALGWDAVKALSKRVVEHLAETLPDRFVAKSGPRNRVGRIYVDYLRNGRGATTVSAWSPRARPGMGVSVPVAWSELDQLTGGAHWTVRTAPERFGASDPWSGYADATRQSLKTAVQALA